MPFGGDFFLLKMARRYTLGILFSKNKNKGGEKSDLYSDQR